MPEIDDQAYGRRISYLDSSDRTLMGSFGGPMHRECNRLVPIGRTSIPAKSLDGQIADLSLEDDPLVEVESSKIVGTPIPI